MSDVNESPLVHWRSIVSVIDRLKHDHASREVVIDDTFHRWVATLDQKHWARYDLSACAFGWSAALDALNHVLCTALEPRRQDGTASSGGASDGDESKEDSNAAPRAC